MFRKGVKKQKQSLKRMTTIGLDLALGSLPRHSHLVFIIEYVLFVIAKDFIVVKL